MAAIWAVAAVVVLGAAACGTKNGADKTPEPLPSPSPVSARVVDAAVTADAAVAMPLDEAGARTLLARAFRDAGFRILHDIPVRGAGFELTLDGFDPRRKVGFEYIDPREAGAELDAAERQALSKSELRVLIVDSGDAHAISAAASGFLARHGRKKKPR